MENTGRRSLLPLLFILCTLFYTFTLAQDGSQDQHNYRAAFGILDSRQDTTCPGGGVCELGNVCCGSGCMFSSGNCCGGDYFCYVGETCQGPNDVGDVDCCISGSCTPAKFVIFYGSGSSGSASGTVASPTAQNSQNAATTNAAGAPATTSSAAPASTSKSGASRLTHGLVGDGGLLCALTLIISPLLLLV